MLFTFELVHFCPESFQANLKLINNITCNGDTKHHLFNYRRFDEFWSVQYEPNLWVNWVIFWFIWFCNERCSHKSYIAILQVLYVKHYFGTIIADTHSHQYHIPIIQNNIYIDGILPQGLCPPGLRMADRALLAGYPRYMLMQGVTNPAAQTLSGPDRPITLCGVLGRSAGANPFFERWVMVE